ncbi:hypothetical protein JB92DRAFT_2836893 [Gautieria morchelliformis]|nr:hypothetical protein JB92DRAFT_2836893 [Gautieria morchelliformis]
MVKLVLHAFVFHCLGVAVHSFVITYSTPQQCGDVEIAWTKPSTPAAQLQFPLLLHILPFNSSATSQQITGWNASMTSGSAVVNSAVSLTGGTKLLLAVTDFTGRGVGPVSDVKTVLTSHDMSCLSSHTRGSPSHFQVLTTPTPSECPSLDVRWDGSVKSPRPTILGFSPGQQPVDMDPPSSPLPTDRSVLIKGTFTSMSKVVVLFHDGVSSGRTSQFVTVGGTDSDGCSSPPNPIVGALNLNQFHIVPSLVMAATLAGVVGLAILILAIFACSWRRHRAIQGPEAVPQTLSVTTESSPPRPSASNSDDLHLVSPSIAHTSTISEDKSDEGEEQVQDLGKNTVTNPSPVIITHAVPLPLPFTEASIFRSMASETHAPDNVGQSPAISEDPVSRPDSPTLPQQPALPTTPRTPKARSLRSHAQRLEKREQYVMLDPSSKAPVLGEVRSPQSPSSRPLSRASRASRIHKAQ